MEQAFWGLGFIASILLILGFGIMAVTLGITYHLPVREWSCTSFDVKQQMCVKYEYVGK